MVDTIAIDPSQRARAVAISTAYKQIGPTPVATLPQRIAIFGQGTTASAVAQTKEQVFSAEEVGTLCGYGSPAHLAAMQLFPANGDGVAPIPVTVYPLDDGGTASAGDITPTVVPTAIGEYKVVINNIATAPVAIDVGDVVADVTAAFTAAINAVAEMPVTAVDGTTTVDLTAKWKGASGDDIYVEVDGPTTLGVSFAFTQPTGGATDPTVDALLTQIGNTWETIIVNCLQSTNTTAIGALSVAGEGRWGSDVRKPFISITGSGEATLATAITVPDARPTDRVSVQITVPGSNDLPCVIAARAAARIAKLANVTPSHDYGGRILDTLTGGTDAQQWTNAQKDTAVKAGTSTTDLIDSVVKMSDTVTYYHPTGEVLPAYRWVVDLMKIWQVIYNLDLIFTAAGWNGAPLVPDDQPVTEPTAKKPKTAKAAAAAMVDQLALRAILSDPETTKPLIQAGINSQNPKRLDLIVPVYLAGNTNQISIDIQFSFYFPA
jgi:phage tail sheath gpL-like